jgi:isocitrate dehydrogenase
MSTPITIARGDGIGPEIMDAVLHILDAAKAPLTYEEIAIGEQCYLAGHTSGMAPEAWESLQRTRVFLKSPITTPQGKGYKSLNVTTRKTLGLFANVRPCRSLHPYVETKHPGLDLVVVRENEEDTYAGIEHRQTQEVTQCLKLITQPGCERIVRYAFEYARANGRRKVTCFSKDNIMKITDGLFHRTFDEISAQYPDIESDHLIIDIGTALLADDPNRFDVIVTLNLYGDIISDVAAQIAGSVGLAGSANIGQDFAMFEAIHGSAPDLAGKGLANPSGLLQGATMMLTHVGHGEVAQKILNAWLCTLEDGIHTGDIVTEGYTKSKVGTMDFAKAVAERLGREPHKLPPVHLGNAERVQVKLSPPAAEKKTLVGVDVFLDWNEDGRDPNVLGRRLGEIAGDVLDLRLITNRGVKVFPDPNPATFCTDHWRCRFRSKTGAPIAHADVIALLSRAAEAGFDFIKTEHLYEFDGAIGFSLGQGE